MANKIKVTDITIDMAKQICDILNRGNQVEVKRERDNIVIVEIDRHALSKNQIQ